MSACSDLSKANNNNNSNNNSNSPHSNRKDACRDNRSRERERRRLLYPAKRCHDNQWGELVSRYRRSNLRNKRHSRDW